MCCSPAQLFLAAQDMCGDLALLSMTAKEAARQVASHCAERGRVILKASQVFTAPALVWWTVRLLRGHVACAALLLLLPTTSLLRIAPAGQRSVPRGIQCHAVHDGRTAGRQLSPCGTPGRLKSLQHPAGVCLTLGTLSGLVGLQLPGLHMQVRGQRAPVCSCCHPPHTGLSHCPPRGGGSDAC